MKTIKGIRLFFAALIFVITLCAPTVAEVITFQGTFELADLHSGVWAPIETIEVTLPTSTIDFQSIDPKFKMLKMVYDVGHNINDGGQVRLRFNSDFGNNYKYYIKSTWSDLQPGAADNSNWIYLAHMGPGLEGSGVGECLITNQPYKYKRVTNTWSDMLNEIYSYSFLGMSSSVWKNSTTTIDKITLQATDGTNVTAFAPGSRVTLMGLK